MGALDDQLTLIVARHAAVPDEQRSASFVDEHEACATAQMSGTRGPLELNEMRLLAHIAAQLEHAPRVLVLVTTRRLGREHKHRAVE